MISKVFSKLVHSVIWGSGGLPAPREDRDQGQGRGTSQSSTGESPAGDTGSGLDPAVPRGSLGSWAGSSCAQGFAGHLGSWAGSSHAQDTLTSSAGHVGDDLSSSTNSSALPSRGAKANKRAKPLLSISRPVPGSKPRAEALPPVPAGFCCLIGVSPPELSLQPPPLGVPSLSNPSLGPAPQNLGFGCFSLTTSVAAPSRCSISIEQAGLKGLTLHRNGGKSTQASLPRELRGCKPSSGGKGIFLALPALCSELREFHLPQAPALPFP